MGQKENPPAKIITRCWQDEEFKNRLLAEPRAILEAEGVDVPEGFTIKVVEDTLQVCHFVIPCKVRGLADGELNWLSGGVVRMPIPKTRHGSC